MPKPRPRQLLAGAVGPTEQAGTPDGDSEEGNNAGSEPPSPALRGDPGGTSDADSLLGWKALAGNAAAGSGDAGTCHLAGGPSPEEHAESKRVQRRLVAALVLALAFMAVEVAGGLWAHSLAILADAAHLLSDSTGFLVAALAAAWSKRAAPRHFSFGYHRVEVLGALASVLAVWVVTINLLAEAVRRIVTPEPVDGKVMFIVAVAGVGVNLLMWLVLGHHHHGLGGGGCCGSGGTPPADATHPAGGAGCAAGAACCAAPTQRWFLSAGPAADLEMGGSKGWERVREGEEAVHSGLVPILAAAGYAQDSSSSSSGDANSRTSSGPQAAGQRGSGTAAAAAPPALAATPAANLNLRGAVIHCIGDLVQSIGVCVAGALIWWHQDDPRWALADPICTFLFAGLVLWTTAGLSRDVADVLMERTPRGVDLDLLALGMGQVPGVAAVADLHVWALTPGIPLMTARVRLAKGASVGPALRRLEEVCARHGIRHCTIQPEQPA